MENREAASDTAGSYSEMEMRAQFVCVKIEVGRGGEKRDGYRFYVKVWFVCIMNIDVTTLCASK